MSRTMTQDAIANTSRTGMAPAVRSITAPEPSAAIGIVTPRNYSARISFGDLEDMSPLDEMRRQRLEQIMAELARNIPVLLCMGGRIIRTYHPDGSIEEHGF